MHAKSNSVKTQTPFSSTHGSFSLFVDRDTSPDAPTLMGGPGSLYMGWGVKDSKHFKGTKDAPVFIKKREKKRDFFAYVGHYRLKPLAKLGTEEWKRLPEEVCLQTYFYL
jgi:hypothetical protein